MQSHPRSSVECMTSIFEEAAFPAAGNDIESGSGEQDKFEGAAVPWEENGFISKENWFLRRSTAYFHMWFCEVLHVSGSQM